MCGTNNGRSQHWVWFDIYRYCGTNFVRTTMLLSTSCCMHLIPSAVYALLLSCHAGICSLNPAVIARLQVPYIILNVL
jgi:hypothetical protein